MHGSEEQEDNQGDDGGHRGSSDRSRQVTAMADGRFHLIVHLILVQMMLVLFPVHGK